MLDGFVTTPERSHTFAAPGTTPEWFRFACSSCQNWEQGDEPASQELVEQGNIDAFLFLGDSIQCDDNSAGADVTAWELTPAPPA